MSDNFEDLLLETPLIPALYWIMKIGQQDAKFLTKNRIKITVIGYEA